MSDSGVLELGIRSELLGLGTGTGIDVYMLDARTRMGVAEWVGVAEVVATGTRPEVMLVVGASSLAVIRGSIEVL